MGLSQGGSGPPRTRSGGFRGVVPPGRHCGQRSRPPCWPRGRSATAVRSWCRTQALAGPASPTRPCSSGRCRCWSRSSPRCGTGPWRGRRPGSASRSRSAASGWSPRAAEAAARPWPAMAWCWCRCSCRPRSRWLRGDCWPDRDPVAVTAVQFLGATLGSLPVAVLTEGVPAAPAGTGAVLAVVALALAGTLLPFTLFAFGQSRVSAEVAGAFLNLEPLVGAIAGAVAFGDPVGLAQVAGGMAILAGIALSSLPLLAGLRVARRAAAVVGAGAGAKSEAGAGAEAGAAGPWSVSAGGVGVGRVGADMPQRTRPPSPEPAAVKARVNERGVLPNRFGRTPQPLNSGERHGGRNGVFVVVRGGKFGAGRAGDMGSRGVRPGFARPGPDRTRPGGRVAGQPPARGRGPTAGGGLGGSGRRATGGRGRSWPGASRGRAAAGR